MLLVEKSGRIVCGENEPVPKMSQVRDWSQNGSAKLSEPPNMAYTMGGSRVVVPDTETMSKAMPGWRLLFATSSQS